MANTSPQRAGSSARIERLACCALGTTGILIAASLAVGAPASGHSRHHGPWIVPRGAGGIVTEIFWSQPHHHGKRRPHGGDRPDALGTDGVPPALLAQRRRANARLRRWMRSHHIKWQAHAADGTSPSVAVFNGLNAAGVAGQDNGRDPPDTTGAIGPDYYVEFLNYGIAVYDRSTLSLVSSEPSTTFDPNFSGDPQIEWDPEPQPGNPQAGRWFYLAVDGGSALAWGFSLTADPHDLVNGWCHYSVSLPAGAVPNGDVDFPKLGHSDTELVFSANVLNGGPQVNGVAGFITAHIWAVSKPQNGNLASCPAASSFTTVGWGDQLHPLTDSDGNLPFAAVPANTADGSPVDSIVASYVPQSGSYDNHLMVWQVSGSGASATLTAEGDLPVTPYGSPGTVPQSGSSGDYINALWGQLDQAVAHADPDAGGQEAVWTAHTISDPAGPPTTVLRWYELLPGAMTVRQQGDVSDPVENVFNGAISPTDAGNAAVVSYNVGGQSMFPDIRTRGRESGLPLGQMGPEITLASSTSANASNAIIDRWGDYAGATPDPVNANVVWGTNELVGPTVNGYSMGLTQNFALQPLDLPPTASFGFSPSSPVADQSVSFTSSSSDPDGTLASYSWDFGDGSSSSAPAPQHAYVSAGSYIVTLTVTDNGGKTASTSQQVTVGDAPPSVGFSFSPSNPTTGQAVSFSGLASDPDGTVGSYAWRFGDGASATGASSQHIYAAAGTYTVTLIATDNGGASATATKQITVTDRPPMAVFSYGPSSPSVGQGVVFDGGGSTDPDGLIAFYAWSFGDGSTGTGPAPEHVYAQAGSYRVVLTVTDNSGGTGTSTAIIAVSVPPGGGPSGGGGPPPSQSSLVLAHLSQSHLVWREPRQRARLATVKPPVGTAFSFALNEPALVSFTFIRRVPGRMVGGRCRPERKRNLHSRPCVQDVREAVLYYPSVAGGNRVWFAGQLAGARWLPPGRYELGVVASDSAGHRSSVQTLAFTIVR